MKKVFLIILVLCSTFSVVAQQYDTAVSPLKGEKWWGGLVALGSQMPFNSTTEWYDLGRKNLNNQVVPLLLSSEGRYIWSEQPFRFRLQNDTLLLHSDYEKLNVISAGKTLKDAYLNASANYFPPSGKLPEEIFFSKPQYNTWIELMYNQNQVDIERYAQDILANNFPTGIFMIDDNWQKYYGNFDFKQEKFPDPAGMIERLHKQGFKVMVWISPFVSADSPEYRFLAQKGYLVREKDGVTPAMIYWWNGVSACYDMTNPEEPKKVTEHKDINDEGQTVTIKEVPETPTPETPGTTTKTSNPPKTGDTANAILWIAILVLSAAGITGVRIWNKKKQIKRLGIEEKKEEEE